MNHFTVGGLGGGGLTEVSVGTTMISHSSETHPGGTPADGTKLGGKEMGSGVDGL